MSTGHQWRFPQFLRDKEWCEKPIEGKEHQGFNSGCLATARFFQAYVLADDDIRRNAMEAFPNLDNEIQWSQPGHLVDIPSGHLVDIPPPAKKAKHEGPDPNPNQKAKHEGGAGN